MIQKKLKEAGQKECSFCEFLKLFRKRLGLTQKELALKTCLSVDTIKRYESNPQKKPHIKFIGSLLGLVDNELEKMLNIPEMEKIPFDIFTEDGLKEFQQLIEKANTMDKELENIEGRYDKATNNRFAELMRDVLTNSLMRLTILQNVNSIINPDEVKNENQNTQNNRD